jgi:hypothetical protein
MREPWLVLVLAGCLAAGCNSSRTTIVQAPLEAPDSLSSISLNGAVELHWTDNPFTSAPQRFASYSVYSTSYSFTSDYLAGLCGTSWVLEGTTVAPEFLVGALTNGIPRCYEVTALAQDGSESDPSPLRQDTPRPDARNVLVYADSADLASSGFRFWDDQNGDGVAQAGELGLVEDPTGGDADFMIHRNPDLSLSIVPVYSGTSMQLYGSMPVDDLTSIDLAPADGYSGTPLEAVPGYGYVFEIVDPGPVTHYGALRVTYVGQDYVIFDWSVQTDPANPELELRGGERTASASGSTVGVSR